ncbi:MAG: Maff2 family protein [Tissierellia bacterium]|nr:Maff2 family protein [Tissierellia bacterium]
MTSAAGLSSSVVINLIEVYGGENSGAKSQEIKHFIPK